MTSTGYGSAAAPSSCRARAGQDRPAAQEGRHHPARDPGRLRDLLLRSADHGVHLHHQGQRPRRHHASRRTPQIFAKQPGGQITISTALRVSLTLAVVTILLTLLLMIPTQLLLHLKYRKVRPVVEIITLLPLVFPPVVLVVGVSDTFIWTQANLAGADRRHADLPAQPGPAVHPGADLRDPGAAVRLPGPRRGPARRSTRTTLVEAARNLGAGWPTVHLAGAACRACAPRSSTPRSCASPW